MPPKSSKKTGKAKVKAATKKQPQPTIYTCPYTNQKVYIGKATLQELKSKTTFANAGKKRLWMIPSASVRQDLYVQAAQALAHHEQALLPTVGGRSWEVSCQLKEPDGTSAILFRAWKGHMELAVLPHLLEKIPAPPNWPGQKSRSDDLDYDATITFDDDPQSDEKCLHQREISTLSQVAWDWREYYPIPTVSYKWKTPERQIFHSRKAAWEHATELAAREVQIQKTLQGIGASGKLLQPSVPSAPTTLKVGKLRFDRDGLWVIGQEFAWQEDRPQEFEEEVAAEEERRQNYVPKSGLELYLKTHRDQYRETHEECTTFRQAETELRKQWRALDKAEKKDWERQVEGYASSSEEEEEEEEEVKEEPEPEPGPEPLKLTMTPKAFYVKSRRHDYCEERRGTGWPIRLSEADIWLREQWKTSMSLETKEEWKQKLIVWESARAEERAIIQQEERTKREAEEAVFAAAEAAAAAEEANRKAVAEEEATKVVAEEEAKKAAAAESARKAALTTTIETKEIPEDSKSLNPVFKDISRPMEVHETENGKSIASGVGISSLVPGAEIQNQSEKQSTDAAASTTVAEDNNYAKADMPGIEEEKEDESGHKPSAVASGDSTLPLDTAEDSKLAEIPSNSPSPTTVTSALVNTVKKKACVKPARRSSTKKRCPPKQDTRWCMTQGQMDMCYGACMEHYEAVMRTVKARDLHRELQDGFDVLRERGFGRYDMELPAFETNDFDFLTDLKQAPWMPVVKTILGEDVVLIHKGCFISMPGAAAQEYHQDGVHLSTQSQRPCHSINVFIPLVDLNTRNGPTEFCRGSHNLGLEGYDRDFVEIPKPKAGTPIIFDYRLGHRGLGNSSQSCRPIVYCTYARSASDGSIKEFRDSVNFSRKRYHKIGEMNSKPLSREERRDQRKRSIETREDKELKKAIDKSKGEQAEKKAKIESIDERKVSEGGEKTDSKTKLPEDAISMSVDQLVST